MVLFRDNPGFEIISVTIRDALQMKTGVMMVQWSDADEAEAEVFTGTQQDVLAAYLACQANGSTLAHVSGSDADDGLITFSVTPPKNDGRVALKAIPPEDFTTSPDTVRLRESPYCAFRSRERRDQLAADGYDEGPWSTASRPTATIGDGQIARERSQAGEEDHTESGDKTRDLVEVVYHFIRVFEDGKPSIYRVVTGNGETVLLAQERVNAIPFAALCPYPISHRFYGQSLADRLIEIQRIKTAILRIMLDSGYYAMNQRVEVVEAGRTANTLTDLMGQPSGRLRPGRCGRHDPPDPGRRPPVPTLAGARIRLGHG